MDILSIAVVVILVLVVYAIRHSDTPNPPSDKGGSGQHGGWAG